MKKMKIFVAVTVAAASVVAYNMFDSKTSSAPLPVVDAEDHEPGPVAILETEELMKLLVDPTFESLKDAIEEPPEARRDWRSLYIAAFNLAEINNLYFLRNDHDYMKTPEWAEYAAKARDEVADLAKTVTERPEYAELKNKFMVVMESCNECHAKFAADEDVDEIEPPLSWQN